MYANPPTTPGLAPGGVWVRLLVDGDIWSETAFTLPEVTDVDQIRTALDQNRQVEIHFFDGDSGQFLSCLDLNDN